MEELGLHCCFEYYVAAHSVLLMHFFLCSGDSESEEDDEIMDADAAKQDDTVAHALAAADALGKTPKNSGTSFLDITDGLKELDMDHYDDEDDGISISKTLCWGCF